MATADEIAGPLADLLSSAMLRAYDIEGRKQFYIWEQKALRWLIDYRKTGDAPINLWTATFCELNHDLIMSKRIGPIDFNLRAFEERRSAADA